MIFKKNPHLNLNLLKRFLYLTLILVLTLAISFLMFNSYFQNRIYPNIYISGLNVGSKTRDQVVSLLKSEIKIPEKITIDFKDKPFDLSLHDIGFSYDFEKTTGKAFSFFRSKNNLINIGEYFQSLQSPKNTDLEIILDQNKLDEYLQVISETVAKEPIPSKVNLNDGVISIYRGQAGEYVDKPLFRNDLLMSLSKRDFSNLTLPFIYRDESLNDQETDSLIKRAEKLVGKNITLENEYDDFILKDTDLLTFLDARNNFNNAIINSYINKNIKPSVNRDPQDGIFNFLDGKVVEFVPAKNGIEVDKDLLTNNIIEQILFLETSDAKTIKIPIPVETTPPKITMAEVNNMGIKELIGRGTSKFAGSIPGRIFNIELASSKFNGVLLPPGETLSFNQILGDVSSYTGYKQAYIIKDGRTVLGDGGGVCQVSTTLFRASLNAGLPIIERRAHSYRVGYYEQDSGPGIDATVFSPTSDLKILNDTPGYVLIQTIFNRAKVSLAFEIYGTSDGRVATITKPVISGITAPPPDLYIDDPTIPIGQVKQIDHKAWGAKASFDYKVERNGENLIDKTFYSNYRPWQSVFLRGTGPVN